MTVSEIIIIIFLKKQILFSPWITLTIAISVSNSTSKSTNAEIIWINISIFFHTILRYRIALFIIQQIHKC
jgi:hypothetical protein